MPMFRSTVAIFLFASGFSSLLESGFSRASTTPFLQRMPMAVPPFSAALMAYSTFAHQHRWQATRAEHLLESFGHRERRRSLLSRSLCLLTSWAVRRSREEGNGESTMIMKRGYRSRGDERRMHGSRRHVISSLEKWINAESRDGSNKRTNLIRGAEVCRRFEGSS